LSKLQQLKKSKLSFGDRMKRYIWNILISVDQLFNTLLAGDPDETLSSRMGKRARKGDKFAKCFCKVLDIVDKNHCEKSIEYDEGKKTDMSL
jgi:hypothetical protein